MRQVGIVAYLGFVASFHSSLFAVSSPPSCMEDPEGDHDDRERQGGPCPAGDHADGEALVGGVSFELPACRSTPGGTRGAGRPRAPPALGRAIPSPVGSGVSPAPAPGVGELAPGRDVDQGDRPGVLPLARGGEDRPDHELATHRAAGRAGRAPLSQASDPPARRAGEEPPRGECGQGSGHQALQCRARHRDRHPHDQVSRHHGGTGASWSEADHPSPAGVQVVCGRPGHVSWGRTQAHDQEKTEGG